MNHEDMFRLHLSGIGKYKGNELIVDDFTSVEFIDCLNKYIVYGYYPTGRLSNKINYSYGKQHGKTIFYRSSGSLLSTRNYVSGVSHGEYVVFNNDGSVLLSYNYTHGVRNDA